MWDPLGPPSEGGTPLLAPAVAAIFAGTLARRRAKLSSSIGRGRWATIAIGFCKLSELSGQATLNSSKPEAAANGAPAAPAPPDLIGTLASW